MNQALIKHLLTGDELNAKDINNLLSLAEKLKETPSLYSNKLYGKQIAIIFEKPSLRTRFSFTAAINQLGGHAIESVSQFRKVEEPKDFIRVIQCYCQAMMIRTFSDANLAEMKKYAKIPIINGLTDLYHPCQALADLLTLKQHFGSLSNLKIAYIGDGNNVLHSLLMLANKLNIEVHYCCPKNHGPSNDIFNKIKNPELIKEFSDPKLAVKGCHAIYTDVWTSMGFSQNDENDFQGFQINEDLMSQAHADAVFMHCMPMERGKEVSENLPDAECSVIFQQSENRLHAQKALLLMLLNIGDNHG